VYAVPLPVDAIFWLSFLQADSIVRAVLDPLSNKPVAIHPGNPKYFIFRDKPLALITATEHHGPVVNRRFDTE